MGCSVSLHAIAEMSAEELATLRSMYAAYKACREVKAEIPIEVVMYFDQQGLFPNIEEGATLEQLEEVAGQDTRLTGDVLESGTVYIEVDKLPPRTKRIKVYVG